MGQLKKYYHEYLTSEDFDLMSDEEYDIWLQKKKEYEILQYEAEKEAYDEALAFNK